MKDYLTTMYLYAVDRSVTVDQPSPDDLNLPSVAANDGTIGNLLQIVFGMAAAIAVLIIVIGALNLTKSNGSPDEIAKAKKTIIYAVVGLVICISAEMILAFVLNKL